MRGTEYPVPPEALFDMWYNATCAQTGTFNKPEKTLKIYVLLHASSVFFNFYGNDFCVYLKRTIWNKEFQNLKIGFIVFKLSWREFFWVILRPRIFFVYEKFSNKNRFFGQIFEILQGVQ